MNDFIFKFILLSSLTFTVGCATAPLTPATPPISTKSAKAATPAKPNHIKYDRKSWGAWADLDKDCQNTRHEILINESLVPVKLSDNDCRALTGKWIDFYTGDVLTDSKQIDIDHVVPVKLAFDLGGYNWDKKQKQKFYNDTDNLVLTSKRNNIQKSANDITVWQPANKGRACNQAKKWVLIKHRYNLEISATEKEYLMLLTGCELVFN